MGEKLHKLTIVVGSTASGKTAWALAEAVKTGGVIVNCDSVQIYKYFDIGTCKPTPEERATVPHFLFDIAEPAELFTAGDFRRAAMPVIESEIKHRPVYVVGGSGFYVQALEKGMYEVPKPSDEVKGEVERLAASGQLLAELERCDPRTAARLHVNDTYRQRRAMEIILSTGLSMTEIQARFDEDRESLKERFDVRKIGLHVPREELRERVDARTARMLESGLLDEVRDLIRRGFAGTKPMGSVGYKECVDVLEGRCEAAQLAASVTDSTMRLAKRQVTWFKRDPEIEWLNR